MNRHTPRQLVIWFLAPALLVGVAGVHTYFAAAMNQTPWEGGGFGMFSTVDKRQARFVRCSLLMPGDTARMRLPDHLRTYIQRLVAASLSRRTGRGDSLSVRSGRSTAPGASLTRGGLDGPPVASV